MSSISGIPSLPAHRAYVADVARVDSAAGGERAARPIEADPVVQRPVQQAEASADVQKTSDEPTKIGEFTAEEQQQIDELKARDAEVRAHEQAHKNVGGQYAGAISYEYQTGPDGKRYAIGGSVPIDVSPEDTPQATINKMDIVIAAALAPVEPSSADRAVAAEARETKSAAQIDLRAERREERAEALETDNGDQSAQDATAAVAATAYAQNSAALAEDFVEGEARAY